MGQQDAHVLSMANQSSRQVNRIMDLNQYLEIMSFNTYVIRILNKLAKRPQRLTQHRVELCSERSLDEYE
eukprot:16452380-Heterocapsa_arctica.AAC.1